MPFNFSLFLHGFHATPSIIVYNKLMKTKIRSILAFAILVLAAAALNSSCTAGAASGSAENAAPAQDAAPTGSSGAPAEDAPPPAVTEWAFPILVSITGADADVNVSAAWGLDYALQKINEQGGIRGIPVKSVVRDTSGGEEKAAAEMSGISGDTLAVFGPAVNLPSDATREIAFAMKIPHIGFAVSAETRDNYAPFAISCTADPGKDAVDALSLWISKNPNIQDLCIFYNPASPQSTARYERMKAFVETEGAGLGINTTYAIEVGNDAFKAAETAKDALATGADTFYIDLDAEGFTRLATQLRHLEVPAGQILGRASTASAELGKSEDLQGVWVWSFGNPDEAPIDRAPFLSANAKSAAAGYTETAADYYEAAFLVKQGIETLGLTGDPAVIESEREQLANWLRDTGDISSLRGPYRIENGAKIVTPQLFSIENGAFAPIA
jgi:branched-chain amino acid transport system substrate-binding protein